MYTLRSDYYYLMNTVFPKEHSFGDIIFPKIGKLLQCMSLSQTEHEWKEAYNSAAAILEYMP